MLKSKAQFKNVISSKSNVKDKVASFDPTISPNDLVDDGTRIKFNLVYWFMGDFIGIGSIRPVYDTPVTSAHSIESDGSDPLMKIGNGTYANGKYYGMTYNSGGGIVMGPKFYQYNAETWELENQINLPEQWSSVYLHSAYNPADNQIYVLAYDNYRVQYLTTLNTSAGLPTFSPYAYCPLDIMTMAFDKNGVLYALVSNGEICTIDLSTGEATPLFRVEDEGEGIYYWHAMAFDHHTGELFWIRSSQYFETDLRRINLDTKTVEIVSDLPDFGAVGAWIESPSAPADAPNTVESIKTTFTPAGSHIGNIEIKAPTTTFGGDMLSGDITLKVSVDGKDAGTLSTTAGGSVTINNHDFLTSGEHKVAVVASNAGGDGPSGSVIAYCGPDTPKNVENVVLDISDDGVVTLNWNAPTEGIHGGYFDPELLTYDVVRYPGAVKVAENQKPTSFSEQLSAGDLTKYYYGVTVACDGIKGEAVESNSMVYGTPMSLPFSESLGDLDLFDLSTIYDVDGDENTWYETWGTLSCASAYHDAGVKVDDWDILPPIYFEPGNYYLELGYSGSSENVSNLEITMGKKATIEAQTDKIGEINIGYTRGNYSVYFVVKEGGKYNIGLHRTATCDGTYDIPYISLSTLKIENGPADNAPEAVVNITAAPFEKGELKTNINFTTPTKDFSGNTLTSLDKVEVYDNNNNLKGVVSPVEPGKSYTFTDENAVNGNNSYVLYAYNEAGRGKRAEASVYAGVDIPDIITSLTYSVNDNHLVTFEWGAPSTTGLRGGYVDPETLTYNFCRSESDYVEPFPVDNGYGLTERKFTWDETGNWYGYPQWMYYYGVIPVNSAGEGPLGYRGLILGTPYSTPFNESVRGGYLNTSVWTTQNITGEQVWRESTGSTIDGIYPSDQDGGMLLFSTTGEKVTQDAVITPLFELKNVSNPVVIFDMYHKANATAGQFLSVQISSNDGQYVPLTSDYIQVKGNEDGWQEHKISLKDYNGKDRLFIAFIGATFEGPASFAIDNIRICDDVDYDLSIESFDVPSSLSLDDEGTFTVNVMSRGTKLVKDYSVDFYADGVMVESIEGTALAMGEKTNLTAKIQPNAANANKKVEYTAVINLSDDANENNNSATAIVEVGGSLLPAPVNLTGSVEGQEVKLAWEEPSKPENASTTDSFEDYESFAIKSVSPWIFYDGDRLLPYGIADLTYPNMDQARAYMVWDPSSVNFNEEAWQPHSGSKCLVAFASSYLTVDDEWDFDQQSDEWLISQHVVGGTELSFYATGVNSYYTEKLQVMVSTTGKNIEDFAPLGETLEISQVGWNKYTFTLPDDAQYFALRYVSVGYQAFALLIDDIEYTPGYSDINLLGYNIYTNGVKENDTPHASREITLDCNSNPSNEYGVSSVYSEGESEMTSITLQTSAANNIKDSANYIVYVEGSSIVVKGAENQAINLYDLNGLEIYKSIGTGNDIIGYVNKGIYLLKVGNKTYKLLVK